MDPHINMFAIFPLHIHHTTVHIYFRIDMISIILHNNMSILINFGMIHNIVKHGSVKFQIRVVDFGCNHINLMGNLLL